MSTQQKIHMDHPKNGIMAYSRFTIPLHGLGIAHMPTGPSSRLVWFNREKTQPDRHSEESLSFRTETSMLYILEKNRIQENIILTPDSLSNNPINIPNDNHGTITRK